MTTIFKPFRVHDYLDSDEMILAYIKEVLSYEYEGDPRDKEEFLNAMYRGALKDLNASIRRRI